MNLCRGTFMGIIVGLTILAGVVYGCRMIANTGSPNSAAPVKMERLSTETLGMGKKP